MTNQESAAEFLRMYKSLTDPEEVSKNKRAADRLKRIEERKSDSCYVV